MTLLTVVFGVPATFGGFVALICAMKCSLMYSSEKLRMPTSAAGLAAA